VLHNIDVLTAEYILGEAAQNTITRPSTRVYTQCHLVQELQCPFKMESLFCPQSKFYTQEFNKNCIKITRENVAISNI